MADTLGKETEPLQISFDKPFLNIKTSHYNFLFDTKFMISSKDDQAASNFARRYHNIGKEIMDKVNDALRKLADNCHKVQGFMINHCVGGGSGSGLAALIMEKLSVNYRGKCKMDFEIYPSNNDNHPESQNVIQAYNELLSMHWTLDDSQLSMVFDNTQLQNICKKPIIPSDINKQKATQRRMLLIDGYVEENHPRVASSLSQKELLYEDIMNLIYSVHDINVNMGYDRVSVKELSEDFFNSKYFGIECLDFDAEEDKYMAACVYYTGQCTSIKCNGVTGDLKANGIMKFVE